MTKLIYSFLLLSITFGFMASAQEVSIFPVESADSRVTITQPDPQHSILDFGSILIGRIIKRATEWAIINNSDKSVFIESLRMTGDEAFYIHNFCRAEIRAHYFCRFWVYFDPTEVKPYRGQVQLLYTSGEIRLIDTFGSGHR